METLVSICYVFVLLLTCTHSLSALSWSDHVCVLLPQLQSVCQGIICLYPVPGSVLMAPCLSTCRDKCLALIASASVCSRYKTDYTNCLDTDICSGVSCVSCFVVPAYDRDCLFSTAGPGEWEDVLTVGYCL